MYKIIVLDIDGILIHNGLSEIFGNFSVSLWLGKRPWLKRIFLRIFEIIEMILISLGFKHVVNESVINTINDERKDNPNLNLFIITDRSLLGIKNISSVLGLLHLEGRDFIQVRGNSLNSLQKNLQRLKEIKTAYKNKGRAWIRKIQCEIKKTKKKKAKEKMMIRELLGIGANVVFSLAVKPQLDVLSHLIATTDISNPRKVLVIDDDQNFLEVVRSLPYNFSTFPFRGMYFSNKGKEAFDAFGHSLQRLFKR